MEVQQGVEKLRRGKEWRRADLLEAWLLENIGQFGDRVLTFDTECARSAGRLSDAAKGEGVHPGFADIAIAAIAQVHRLTTLLKHFTPLRVACLDPFKAFPH